MRNMDLELYMMLLRNSLEAYFYMRNMGFECFERK
jgi:hypothetical protein